MNESRVLLPLLVRGVGDVKDLRGLHPSLVPLPGQELRNYEPHGSLEA